MALRKDGEVIPEVNLDTIKETKQNKETTNKKETKRGRKPKVKTEEKTPVKTGENDFEKAEEIINKKAEQKSQNTGNQGVDDLADFLSIETENDINQGPESMHKNPPLPSVGNSENYEDEESEEIEDFEVSDSDDPDIFETDFNGSELFDDEELVSEFLIELLDTGVSFGASAIAKDMGNTDKWALSDKRKKKLQKPLMKLLANKEVKMKPEYAFIGLLLSFYAPTLIKAFAERQDKKKLEKKNNLMTTAQKNAIDLSDKQSTGREPKCQRCKNTISNCICPEGPKLSKYMKEKLKG
jgi:hypothetical protein